MAERVADRHRRGAGHRRRDGPAAGRRRLATRPGRPRRRRPRPRATRSRPEPSSRRCARRAVTQAVAVVADVRDQPGARRRGGDRRWSASAGSTPRWRWPAASSAGQPAWATGEDDVVDDDRHQPRGGVAAGAGRGAGPARPPDAAPGSLRRGLVGRRHARSAAPRRVLGGQARRDRVRPQPRRRARTRRASPSTPSRPGRPRPRCSTRRPWCTDSTTPPSSPPTTSSAAAHRSGRGRGDAALAVRTRQQCHHRRRAPRRRRHDGGVSSASAHLAGGPRPGHPAHRRWHGPRRRRPAAAAPGHRRGVPLRRRPGRRRTDRVDTRAVSGSFGACSTPASPTPGRPPRHAASTTSPWSFPCTTAPTRSPPPSPTSARVGAVVVVDDGSVERRRGAVAGAARSHGGAPRGEPWTGGGAQHRVATGDTELVAFVDADCRPAEGWLVGAAAPLRRSAGRRGRAPHHHRGIVGRPAAVAGRLRAGPPHARPRGRRGGGATGQPRAVRAHRGARGAPIGARGVRGLRRDDAGR